MSIFHTIFNFKKLNFCNFSTHLLSPHKPRHFPFQGHPTQQEFPTKIPCIFPGLLTFQVVSYAAEAPNHLPGLFPLVRSFRGILRNGTPIQCPVVSPCFSPFRGGILRSRTSPSSPRSFSACPPFQGESCGGRFMPQIYMFSSKLNHFCNKLSLI